jgi:hypothetical protein
VKKSWPVRQGYKVDKRGRRIQVTLRSPPPKPQSEGFIAQDRGSSVWVRGRRAWLPAEHLFPN